MIRFKLIGRVGHSITALACCIGRPSEILAAVADYSIKCIDVGESVCRILTVKKLITHRLENFNIKNLSMVIPMLKIYHRVSILLYTRIDPLSSKMF